MEHSKTEKKKMQNRLNQRRYVSRIRNALGSTGDELRKKYARRVRASKKKARVKNIQKDPLKKLRKIRKLIYDIDWDDCVTELGISESSEEIFTLRAPSYLKNRKQRKLMQDYVALYSEEIFFGVATKKMLRPFWPNVNEVYQNEDLITLSVKVKIKNKIIRIPSLRDAENSEKFYPFPRKLAAVCLWCYNIILLFRDGTLYVSKHINTDDEKIIYIKSKPQCEWTRDDPVTWLENHFSNLKFEVSQNVLNGCVKKYLKGEPPTILF
jgi:hypothetical protein